MSVNNNDTALKQSVQNAVKQALIDTKYNDEPVTFGQAIVTHYFLNQLGIQHATTAPQSQSQSMQNVSHDGPVTQSQHLHDLTKSTNNLPHLEPNHAVVQFDLIKQDYPEFKPKFGRKKGFGKDNEATCVKDVFHWDDGNSENFRHYRLAKDQDYTIRNKLWEESLQESFKDKKIKEIERSPNKWQSEQRDQYRIFIDGKTADEMKKPKAVANQAARAETLSPQKNAAAADKQDNIGDHLSANQIVVGSQQLMNTQQQEETGAQSNATTAAQEKDHHRKVRINKENIKKRPQSAKQKTKPDPTRENFKGPTRWLPDSAFTTYFGKPAFHSYGMANINPVNGGNIYGQYMLSHNINPESGANLPQYQQVYKNALQYGLRKNDGMRQPELPRQPKSAATITASKPAEVTLKSKLEPPSRNSIMPDDGPRTLAKKLGKSKVQTIKILPPAKDKVIKHKTPASNPFQIHDNSPSKRSHRQSSANSRQGGGFDLEEVHNNGQPNYLDQHQNYEDHHHHNNDFSQGDFVQMDDRQDIGDADHYHNHDQNANPNVVHAAGIPTPGGPNNGLYIPLCEHPTDRKVDNKELNPKYYQFVPACWTQRIRPAGRETFKCERLYDVLTQNE